MSELRCLHCIKTKSYLDKDYSNYNFKKKDHAFPNRIEFPKIPIVNREEYFICADCATKLYPLRCHVHGKVPGQYQFGNSPICEKCENEKTEIFNEKLPVSFKGVIQLSKISQAKKYLNKNIYLAVSKNNNIHLIEQNYHLSDGVNNFSFEIFFKNEDLCFSGKHNSMLGEQFEIIIKSIDDIGMGIGEWIDPWLELLKRNLHNSKEIYFSQFRYSTVSLNFQPKTSNNFFTFWTLKDNAVCAFEKGSFPPFEAINNWAVRQKNNGYEIKLLFEKNYLPSLLEIHQATPNGGINSIASISKFPEDKKCDYSQITLESFVGLFMFVINNKQEKVLIEKSYKFIALKSLIDGKKYQFDFGYIKENFLLLINSKNKMYSISSESLSQFEGLLTSLKRPDSFFTNGDDKTIICFDEKSSGKIWEITFYGLGFELNKKRFLYDDLKKSNMTINQADGTATLTIELKGNKIFQFWGPESYIKLAWQQFENVRVSKNIEQLSTNDLYREYNKRKKENLLIGLLSDITLFNKEIDSEIALDVLMAQLESLSDDEFSKNKKVYEQTVHKLLLISNLLPKIKKDYVRIDTYYPHFQLQNELNFISKAFGRDVAQSMEKIEFENVIRASRNNIGFLQNKFNKIFFEIEKSINVIENIFVEQKIQKSFMARMAKFSVKGGQAILIGGLISAGATMGGVGVLAGMLGIRTMGDILSSVHFDKKQNKLIKDSAYKIFGWWQIFKETFPMIVYETGKMIEIENERTVARDNKIFRNLNQQKKISIEDLNETLKTEIERSNQIRFQEILTNTGILFDGIANEINKAIEKTDYLSLENSFNNQLYKPMTVGGFEYDR